MIGASNHFEVAITNKYETDAALRRDGVIDPALDAIGKESQRTIEAHLADYESKMRAANRTDEHVRRTIGFVRTISEWAEFAMSGAHPKVVQQVMRHSTITRTMDTYGHLFPGQEADAVVGMRDLLFSLPEALMATGTDDNCPLGTQDAQRLAQRAERETRRSDASGCDDRAKPAAQRESPKPLQIADLGDDVRRDAKENEGRPGRTRKSCNFAGKAADSRRGWGDRWGHRRRFTPVASHHRRLAKPSR